jgi:uncharacterized protein involved in exopolysaccharide biosynthesis
MDKEISSQDLKRILKSWYSYLISKWKLFILVALILGIAGVVYAWFDKPVYTAELTFASEGESSGNIGAYAGIAAQFGLDLGSGGSSAFAGENLMHLMTSRRLIKQTLFTPTNTNEGNVLLINYYLKIVDEKKSGIKSREEKIVFNSENEPRSRQADSVEKKICIAISKSLTIEKVDKKSDIISVRYQSEDEWFAKTFVEELVNNVISYYTDYKIKKSGQNVAILQRQTDSVRNLINGNIVDIAVSNDLNVNPTRQILRTGVQRKQVDAQVNSALYTELVKNLELSKLTLRKETPLVQIIDSPMLPLEKKKKGRLLTGIVFAVVGCFITSLYLVVKKLLE